MRFSHRYAEFFGAASLKDLEDKVYEEGKEIMIYLPKNGILPIFKLP